MMGDNYDKLKNAKQNDDENPKNDDMEPQYCNIIDYNDEIEFQNHLFGDCMSFIDANGQISNIMQNKDLEMQEEFSNTKIEITKDAKLLVPNNDIPNIVKLSVNNNVQLNIKTVKPLKETTNNNDMLLLKYSKLANSAYYDMILNGFNRPNVGEPQRQINIQQNVINTGNAEAQNTAKTINPLQLNKMEQILPKNRVQRLKAPKAEKSTTQAELICPVESCGTICRNKVALRKHMYRHNENLFKCPTCDKGFLENSKLKRHQLVHNGEKSLDCPFPECGKSFSLAYNLRKHLEVHYSTGPHHCPMDGCNKVFKRTAYYAEHIKVCKGKVKKAHASATRMKATKSDNKPADNGS